MKAMITVDDREVMRAFQELVKIAPEKVKKAVSTSAMATLRAAKKNCTAVDTGLLRSQITQRVVDNGFGREVGTNIPYAGYIEWGTGPAAGHDRYMPPPGVLLVWMGRHGIPEDAEYKIRWKIYNYGTKPRPFLFPAFEQERPHFIDRIMASLKEAVSESRGF